MNVITARDLPRSPTPGAGWAGRSVVEAEAALTTGRRAISRRLPWRHSSRPSTGGGRWPGWDRAARCRSPRRPEPRPGSARPARRPASAQSSPSGLTTPCRPESSGAPCPPRCAARGGTGRAAGAGTRCASFAGHRDPCVRWRSPSACPLLGAAALLVRRPWLVAPLAVLALPFRIPIATGGTTANLLVPLYFVVAAAALAWIYGTFRAPAPAARPAPTAGPAPAPARSGDL